MNITRRRIIWSTDVVYRYRSGCTCAVGWPQFRPCDDENYEANVTNTGRLTAWQNFNNFWSDHFQSKQPARMLFRIARQRCWCSRVRVVATRTEVMMAQSVTKTGSLTGCKNFNHCCSLFWPLSERATSAYVIRIARQRHWYSFIPVVATRTEVNGGQRWTKNTGQSERVKTKIRRNGRSTSIHHVEEMKITEAIWLGLLLWERKIL